MPVRVIAAIHSSFGSHAFFSLYARERANSRLMSSSMRGQYDYLLSYLTLLNLPNPTKSSTIYMLTKAEARVSRRFLLSTSEREPKEWPKKHDPLISQ